MENKKLKPIIRIPGSKFKKIDLIFEKFNFPVDKKFNFIEPFGGSLIIGANVAYRYLKSIVNVNDYDKFYNLKENCFNFSKLHKNQTSYAGLSKNMTTAAITQFDKRLKNGYMNLVAHWNELSKRNLNIQQFDWKEFVNFQNSELESYLFIDPPYFGKKYEKLYKNKVNHTELFKWLSVLKNSKLNNAKILICLNDTTEIREIFKNWIIEEINFTYTLTSNNAIKREKELFIRNFN